jgi:DNA polymerase-3 subunit gamma/tau
MQYLDHVLEQEKITFEKPALRLLAEGANGSMRDALSLTDQAISFTAGNVTLSAVIDMLGSLDQTYLIRILDALAKRDGEALVLISDELAQRSLSFHEALKDLGVLFNRIALAQTAPNALSEDLPEYEAILGFAKQFHPEDIQLFYQIAVHGRHELGLAPDPYAGFTMTLLRMLAFQPEKENQSETPPVISRQPSLAPPKTSPPPAPPAAFANDKTVSGRIQTDSLPVSNTVQDTVLMNLDPNLLATDPEDEEVHQDKPAILTVEWDENWPGLAQALPLQGMAQQLAEQSEMVNWKLTDDALHIHLRSPIESLCAPAHVEKLTEALINQFECTVKITTEIGKVGITASQFAQDLRESKQREAEQVIKNDLYIQTILQEFGASLVPNSIKLI